MAFFISTKNLVAAIQASVKTLLDAQTAQLITGFNNLLNQVKGPLMADLQSIKASLAAQATELATLDTDVTNAATLLKNEAAQIAALSKQVADLQAQIAAGNPVTAQDLADIQTALDASNSNISAQATALEAAVAPPATPAA